jgi:thiol-disulfide isomerase/thioredoxin
MHRFQFRQILGTAIRVVTLVSLGALGACSTPIPFTNDPLAQEPIPGAGIALTFSETPVPLPRFDLIDVNGTPIDQAAWAGKVVILNFWATWCGPCRLEIPDLIALQERYGDSLVVVGLSLDDGPVADVQQFVKAQNINYPVAVVSGEIQAQFGGINAVPSTFIVTRDGMITQRHVGLLNSDYTEQEVRSLAGFPTAATVSWDPSLGARLLNRSEFQSRIPTVDLSGLSDADRIEALKRLNTEKCTCGCGLTVAQCLVDDPTCGTSPTIAAQIMATIRNKSN